MNDPITPEQERRLAARLKSEAEALRPRFSPELHARIVRQLDAQPRLGNRRQTPRRWLLAGGAAAAAAVLLGLVFQSFFRAPPARGRPAAPLVESAGPPVADALADLNVLADLPPSTAAGLGAQVDAALQSRHWTHLQHDAHTGARLLLDSLPLEMLVSADPPPRR